VSAQPENRPALTIGNEGEVIAGRYRLLAQVGADTSVHAAFWQARDTVLQRDVGLTLLLRSGDPGEYDRATDLIDRALRWGGFCDLGAARLLDVMRRDNGSLPDDVLGLAVTEWVPGQSLKDVISATGSRAPLRTPTALAMLDPLAEAAEAAHRQGLVLGCAHPSRIRFTPEGTARLAFALPNAETTPADDVRGLGATLYTLLTGHWPLAGTDAELAGLPAAPRDVQDVVVPPGILRPGLSLEISALALGALGAGAPHGRIHTAAAVHKVIGELLAGEQEAAMLPPPHDGAPLDVDEVWSDRLAPDTVPDPERQRKLRLWMGGLGGAAAIVLIFVLFQLGSLLGVTPTSGPPIVLSSPAPPTPVAAPAAPVAGGGGASAPAAGTGGAVQGPAVHGPAAPPAADGAVPGLGIPPVESSGLVQPAATMVFDPSGDPDNTGRVSRAVDDDPSSSWSTYIYRRPFPALKPGVGLLVSFASPVQLSQLTITSPSRGTRIEIRSAPGPDTTLAQTVPIASAALDNDVTTVSMVGSQPVQHVLLWITQLGGGGDENVTEISDIRFERALG
jgi:hypothetical protein